MTCWPHASTHKVEHHGSHNATLRKDGLELMVRDDLVVLISTDAEFALKQGKGWLMPNPTVREALSKQAKKRVVRDKLTSVGKEEKEALKEIIQEGEDELYVDVLAYGAWLDGYAS